MSSCQTTTTVLHFGEIGPNRARKTLVAQGSSLRKGEWREEGASLWPDHPIRSNRQTWLCSQQLFSQLADNRVFLSFFFWARERDASRARDPLRNGDCAQNLMSVNGVAAVSTTWWKCLIHGGDVAGSNYRVFVTKKFKGCVEYEESRWREYTAPTRYVLGQFDIILRRRVRV